MVWKKITLIIVICSVILPSYLINANQPLSSIDYRNVPPPVEKKKAKKKQLKRKSSKKGIKKTTKRNPARPISMMVIGSIMVIGGIILLVYFASRAGCTLSAGALLAVIGVFGGIVLILGGLALIIIGAIWYHRKFRK